ncbi:MAG: hypothetical protein OEV42_20015 [Deltaproteobacteria bacterium]|nr:hypothetical protein [Deltaproteobacteria bacterium]
MTKPNWILGVIILLLPALFVMKYTAVPYPFYPDSAAELKLAFQHTGQRVQEYDEVGSLRKKAREYRKALKKDKKVRMSLKSRATTTRERFPTAMEVFIDGKKIHQKEYQPTGRKRDAVAVIYDVLPIVPGIHTIRVTMLDSKKEGVKPYVFEDTVEFKARDVRVITFDKVRRRLHWSNNLIPILDRPEYTGEEN